MKPSVLVLFVLLAGHAHADTWERLYSSRSTDAFRSVIETPSGDFVAAGYSADFTPNDTDAFAVSYDSQGDTNWTLTMNGPLSKKDLFYKVNAAPQGFIFCGYSNSFSPSVSERALVVRTNEQGDIQWASTWDNPGRSRAQDVIVTQDSGFALTGYVVDGIQFSGFILRLEANGDTLWSRKYAFPGSNYSDLNSIRQLSDGGFVACGQCRIGNDYDIFLVRTDSAGNELWSKNLGTISGGTENGECVFESGGGFILCGSTDSTSVNGTTDGYLLATDSLGNLLWSRVYGDPQVNDDFHQVSPVTDNGWVLCGTTRSFGPSLPNIWLVRTDSSGSIVWNRTFGGSNHDHGYSGIQTSDGGFVCAGYASSFNFNFEDAYLIRCDSSGDLDDYLHYGAVTGIVSPSAGSCADDSTLLVVSIANMGRDTLSDFTVHVEIDGGGIHITESWIYYGVVFPGDVVLDTLPTPISLQGDTCDLAFYVELDTDNDVIPPRNSLNEWRNLIQPPSTTGDERCGPGSITVLAQSPCENLLWFTQPLGGNIVNAGTSFTFQASGDTTLYVQSGSFCPRVPVQSTVHPLPVVALEQGADTVTKALPYSLQAPSGFVSYVWSTFQNTPAIQVDLPGFYCVTVIDNFGCAGSDCIYVIDSVLSYSPELAGGGWKVYPNPASDRLVVEGPEGGSSFRIEVLDLCGRSHMILHSENGRCVIDVSGLLSGSYLLRKVDAAEAQQLRFIKR